MGRITGIGRGVGNLGGIAKLGSGLFNKLN